MVPSHHVIEEGLLLHAVARVKDDWRQQDVEKDFRVEGGGLLLVALILAVDAGAVLKLLDFR